MPAWRNKFQELLRCPTRTLNRWNWCQPRRPRKSVIGKTLTKGRQGRQGKLPFQVCMICFKPHFIQEMFQVCRSQPHFRLFPDLKRLVSFWSLGWMALVPEIHRSAADLGSESEDCWGITLRVTWLFCFCLLDDVGWFDVTLEQLKSNIGLFCSWTWFSFPMTGSTRSGRAFGSCVQGLTVSWQDTTLLDSSLGVCVMLILNCRATNGVNWLTCSCTASQPICVASWCNVRNALLIAFELECDGAHASVFVGLSDGMQCQDAMPLFYVGASGRLMLAHLALFSIGVSIWITKHGILEQSTVIAWPPWR